MEIWEDLWGKTVNKFQVLICKMYLLVYLYHKDYKTFLMDREAYSGSRFGVLLGIKFSYLYYFFRNYINYNYVSNTDKKLLLFILIIVVFLIIERTVSFSKKNYKKVSLNISRKEVKIIYHFWHFALVGLLIFLIFI